MYVAMDTQSERWELRRGLLFAPAKELIIIFSCPRLVCRSIPQQYPLQNLYTWSVNRRIKDWHMNNNMNVPEGNSLYICICMCMYVYQMARSKFNGEKHHSLLC